MLKKYMEKRCVVTRQTAATYLNSLVDVGLLEIDKVFIKMLD